MPRLSVVLASVFGLLGVGLAALVLHVRHPRPSGVAGPAADELARALERAVDRPAWERTQAVRWTFGGRHQLLWDRRRGLCRVRSGDDEVLVDLGQQRGVARRRGVQLQGKAADKAVRKAYAAWVNDSFWLNPLAKLFDEGTERLLVKDPSGKDALLVQYKSGGLTPGDGYLWLLGDDGRPRAWQLFVSIIPVSGVEGTWDGWTRLSTGAWISTRHQLAGFLPLLLSDVAGAATLAELEPGSDPFAGLGP